MSHVVENPDGPLDWHRKLEELRDKLRTVEIDRNQVHSRAIRASDLLVDAILQASASQRMEHALAGMSEAVEMLRAEAPEPSTDKTTAV